MNNQAAQTMPDNPELVNPSLDDAWKNIITNYGLNPIHRDVAAVTHALAKFALSQTAGVAEGWRAVDDVSPPLGRLGPYLVAGGDYCVIAQGRDSAGKILEQMTGKPIAFVAEKFAPLDAVLSMLAAAPAASGGEDGWQRMTKEARAIQMRHLDKHDGDVYHAMQALVVKHGYRSTEPMTQPIEPKPPSAASVSERARKLLEQSRNGRALRNDGLVEVGQAIDAIEQALTQQRGEFRDVGNWLWVQLMDWCRSQRIAPATQDKLFGIVERARKQFPATTPQPSADAVRELVKRWRDLALDPNNRGFDNACIKCADELESLLGRGG